MNGAIPQIVDRAGPAVRDESQVDPSRRKTGPAPLATAPAAVGMPRAAPRLLAAGGVLGAIASSMCCIVPLMPFIFGISGAWIGNLTALRPYRPIFLAITAGFIGTAFYLVYRRPKVTCADGTVCAKPPSNRFVKLALWGATALAAAAIAFPYAAPMGLG